ncbi:hypothetical protein F4776DRAFT_641222 [Hypoxylon sp. NC0597]|nr:hypothetical protein F4776DRAFT_641222 [Hypoxylon sp. NC0597]
MSNKAESSSAPKSKASTSQLPPSRIPEHPPEPPAFKGRKHAALKGNPTGPVSAEQWENVNQAIEKTVELILSRKLALDSLRPGCWVMHEGLGVALVAEIRRPIREVCSLTNPKLQNKLRKMASDVTHKEFRFLYQGGGVWFRFKMTDLKKATQPRGNQAPEASPEADETQKPTDDKTSSTTETDDPSQEKITDPANKA